MVESVARFLCPTAVFGDVNIVLIVPDGVGLRNVVLGNVARALDDRHNVTILHAVPDHLVADFRCHAGADVEWESLTPYGESPLAFCLRHTISYAHMYAANTRGMRLRLMRPVTGSWRTRTVHRAAKALGRCLAFPTAVDRIERVYFRYVQTRPEVSAYGDCLRRIKPDVICCSHQRPPIVLPPILAARNMGISTTTAIFSWDNLTSKSRIVAPFDSYLVWSELMKQEFLKIYQSVPANRIHIVGTPQFDAYANSNLLWSRKVFCDHIGAAGDKTLICYSGGDRYTSPDDQDYVRNIMELIRCGRIAGSPQMIVRPAPVDDGARFDAVRRDFPEIIYCRPAWSKVRPQDWAASLPTASDVQFIANLTHHADLNVNVASTMTIDFAIHDKPVVNIAYDVHDPPRFGVRLWDYYYKYDHYQPVIELGAARFAHSPEMLAEHINTYLRDPSLDRENRKKLVTLELGTTLGRSAALLANTLEQIGR